MTFLTEGAIPVDVIYNTIKSLGLKTSEWRDEIEDRAITINKQSKLKIIFKNAIPNGLFNLIKEKLNSFLGKQYSVILEEFENISGMSAKDIIEIFGEDSVIYAVKKRGSRPKDWKTGLNSSKTIIKITHPKIIKAIDENKVLYHIATIDINQNITDLENYDKDFRDLFEHDIFDDIVELKSSSKKSYFGFY